MRSASRTCGRSGSPTRRWIASTPLSVWTWGPARPRRPPCRSWVRSSPCAVDGPAGTWTRARAESTPESVAEASTTLDKLRAICLALPEVTERASHSAPTWFVRGKSSFVTLWESGHHDHHFAHLWCAAGPGVQAELVETEPERFFRP